MRTRLSHTTRASWPNSGECRGGAGRSSTAPPRFRDLERRGDASSEPGHSRGGEPTPWRLDPADLRTRWEAAASVGGAATRPCVGARWISEGPRVLTLLATLMAGAGLVLAALAAYVAWRRGTRMGWSLAVLLVAVAW